MSKRGTLCYFLAVALFLYLHFFIPPATPILPLGDQTLFLFNGARLLHGEVMYRDFFQFLFPGSEALWWALFSLFGVRAWLVNAALISFGVGIAGVSLAISRKLFGGVSVFLPGLLFFAIAFRSVALAGTHHLWDTPLILAALAVVIEKRSLRRLAAAGALCGVSAWFNQTRGPVGLLGFAVFLVWETHATQQAWRPLLRRLAAMLVSFLATLTALTGYFVWQAGLKNFIFCTITFLLKYCPAYPANSWRAFGTDFPAFAKWYTSPHAWTWLAITLLVSSIYILLFFRVWRERKAHPEEPWDRLIMVAIVGFCLFLSVAPSALNYRLASVSLPAFILLVWFVKWPARTERVALGFLWVAVLGLMIGQSCYNQTRWRVILPLPIGRTAIFYHPLSDVLHWFRTEARPTDHLFGDTILNFDLALPTAVAITWPTTTDYTRPEQVSGVIKTLDATRTRWIVWSPEIDFYQGPGDNLDPLRAYLHRHYHLATAFSSGEYQVWRRNE